jgi:hypothetical protein
MSGDDPEDAGWHRAPDTALNMDKSMLTGCVVFALASLGVCFSFMLPYLLSDRPLTYEALYRLVCLTTCLAFCWGVVLILLGEMAGFCGSVSGLLPACVFVWLRLRDASVGLPGVEAMVAAEFPEAVAWFGPLVQAFVLVVVWSLILWLRLRLRFTSSTP